MRLVLLELGSTWDRAVFFIPLTKVLLSALFRSGVKESACEASVGLNQSC